MSAKKADVLAALARDAEKEQASDLLPVILAHTGAVTGLEAWGGAGS